MRRPKLAARPYTPTRAEVFEHEVTCVPYRSWCKRFAHRRGVSSPHVRPDKKEKIGITIRMGFCFMNGEEDEVWSLPGVLLIWGWQPRMLVGIAGGEKGPS